MSVKNINHPTVIKRKDTEKLISHLNDIASNGKTATNDCPNATGNNSPIVQKENSLEPQGFKRVSLGGATATQFELWRYKQVVLYVNYFNV